jgi:hypothetical protein
VERLHFSLKPVVGSPLDSIRRKGKKMKVYDSLPDNEIYVKEDNEAVMNIILEAISSRQRTITSITPFVKIFKLK